MGKYFSYSTRHEELFECSKSVQTAIIRIKLDVNGTRVTAQDGLLHFILRRNKAPSCYQMNKDVRWELVASDWENIRFFESALSMTDNSIKLSQDEKKFVGALSALIKMDLLKRLRDDYISVFEFKALTASSRIPRVNIHVNDLTPVISECSQSALLEAERRYCVSKTEQLTRKEYFPSEREIGATLLDLRTVIAKHLMPQQK